MAGHRFEELEQLGQRRPACDECGSECLPGYRLPWWLAEDGVTPLWGWWCGACVRRAGLRPVAEGTRRIEAQLAIGVGVQETLTGFHLEPGYLNGDGKAAKA